MSTAQQPIVIDTSALLQKAQEMRTAGFRFVQVACTTLADQFEITYSFDKDLDLVNVRVMVPKSDPVLPSVTSAYLCAFTYENELQDLFGLKVTDLAINYNGKFYQTAIKTPFNAGSTAPQAQ